VRTFFKPAEDLFTIVTQEQLQNVFPNATNGLYWDLTFDLLFTKPMPSLLNSVRYEKLWVY